MSNHKIKPHDAFVNCYLLASTVIFSVYLAGLGTDIVKLKGAIHVFSS